MSFFTTLSEIDQRISNRIRLPEQAGLTRRIASFFAHSGDSWFCLAAMGIIWLFTHNPWHRLMALMGVSTVVLALVVFGVKFLIRRRRPEGDWGAIYRNTDPHSFPSGHAARTAMLALLGFALGPLWLGIVLALWAPLVGLARVMMGVHYVSDVLAGAAFGLLFGWGFLFITDFLIRLVPFIF